jgi:hypothetical protein
MPCASRAFERLLNMFRIEFECCYVPEHFLSAVLRHKDVVFAMWGGLSVAASGRRRQSAVRRSLARQMAAQTTWDQCVTTR